ncbi:MAG TPA: hypothetical protein O0X42_00745 [Methanocorpusculum sp.]|nr:hypothetical protein [Methanocorpusculum sp.]
MNFKHLTLLGAIALVVFGCVLAAGCTSSETGSDDKIIGTWTFPYNDGNGIAGIGIDVINKDGTGFYVITTDDGTRLLKYDEFTWKKNSDGTYAFTFARENLLLTAAYDSAADTYTDNIYNTIHTRLDPITGIWFNEKKDDNGKTVKSATSLYTDGTGWMSFWNEDGTTEVIRVAWKKNDDGTYTLVKANKEVRVWTLDSAQQKVTSSTGRVLTKKFTDSYYYLSVLGPWYNPDNGVFTVFNADGTGTTYKGVGNAVSKFSWTVPEFGTFKLVELEGENKGYERLWTYDRQKNTFTTPNNNTLVRPGENTDWLTITCFPEETLPGLWYGPASSGNGGKTSTLFKPDGTSVVTVSYADAGTAKIVTGSWKKNADGTYAADFSTGEKRTYILEPSGLSVSSSGGSVKQRVFLDSEFKSYVTGPWYNEKGGVFAVFNADGTGFVNPGSGVIPFTWNTDGTGKITTTYTGGVNVNGENLTGQVREWTYDSKNNTLFISAYDAAYVRPTKDIEGKLTFV